MLTPSTVRRRGKGALLAALSLLVVGIIALVWSLVGQEDEAVGARRDDPPVGVSWAVPFEDQFGGSALDRSHWRTGRYGAGANEAPYNPDKESAFYAPGGVSVVQGRARLSLTSVSPWIEINGKYYGHRSGVMTTRGKFAVRPGDFVQGRILIPRGAGLWPAFWMTPVDGSWPPEIDQFEFFNTAVDKRPYFSYLDTKGSWSGPTAYGDMATDYVGSWHTYGLYWRPDGTMVPYIDGVARPEAAKPADTKKSMFIILNLALQSGFKSPADAHMDIDWVKVFRPRA